MRPGAVTATVAPDHTLSAIGTPAHGLHIPPNAYRGLMRDLDRAMAEQAEDAEAHPLPPPGDVGRGRRRADNVSPIQHGNQADYLARRIARDRPGLLVVVDRRS
jgi:hypothetical protein